MEYAEPFEFAINAPLKLADDLLMSNDARMAMKLTALRKGRKVTSLFGIDDQHSIANFEFSIIGHALLRRVITTSSPSRIRTRVTSWSCLCFLIHLMIFQSTGNHQILPRSVETIPLLTDLATDFKNTSSLSSSLASHCVRTHNDNA